MCDVFVYVCVYVCVCAFLCMSVFVCVCVYVYMNECVSVFIFFVFVC